MEGGIIIVKYCALEVPESNASTLPPLLFYLHLIWTFSPPPMQQRHRQRILVPLLDINDGTGSIPESWTDKIVTYTILYALTDYTSIQTLPFYLIGFAPKSFVTWRPSKKENNKRVNIAQV